MFRPGEEVVIAHTYVVCSVVLLAILLHILDSLLPKRLTRRTITVNIIGSFSNEYLYTSTSAITCQSIIIMQEFLCVLSI